LESLPIFYYIFGSLFTDEVLVAVLYLPRGFFFKEEELYKVEVPASDQKYFEPSFLRPSRSKASSIGENFVREDTLPSLQAVIQSLLMNGPSPLRKSTACSFG